MRSDTESIPSTPSDERLRQVLHDYFECAATTTMARYHRSEEDVPDGLRILHWSWEGLVGAPSPDGV